MSSSMKRRLITVSGIIVIVLIIVLAVIGSNTAAKNVTVAEAAQGNYNDQKLQVTGNVEPGSFSTDNNTLTFTLYDPDDPSATIAVIYDGAASSTFGNDVTTICTGRMDSDGTLQCSELVTKCPSKYESAANALTVDQLLGYDRDMTGTVVKLAGTVVNGSLKPAGEGDRFFIANPESGVRLAVCFDGALPDDITDNSSVVLTGYLSDTDSFTATDVALEG